MTAVPKLTGLFQVLTKIINKCEFDEIAFECGVILGFLINYCRGGYYPPVFVPIYVRIVEETADKIIENSKKNVYRYDIFLTMLTKHDIILTA